MQPKTKLTLCLLALLLLPAALAGHNTDTHIEAERVYTRDAQVWGRAYVNGTLQTNGTMLRFGDPGSPILGNLTNETLTDYRSWTLPDASGVLGLSTTTLTPGSVIFAGTGGMLSQDNAAFFWDAANNRIGIGTATPTHPFSVAADAATAPMNLSRPATNTGSAIVFYNADTTNNNGLGFGYFSATTGTGASGGVEFARMSLVAEQHDHATMAGAVTFSTVDSTGTSSERLRIDAGGGIRLRNDGNAAFYRSGSAAILTNATWTFNTGKAVVLQPTATATLPPATSGALVYDGTTNQFKAGVSGAYQVLSCIGCTETFSAVKTFSADPVWSGSSSGTFTISTGSVPQITIGRFPGANAAGPSMTFQKARGTTSLPEDVQSGDEIGKLIARPYSGGFGSLTSARIQFTVDGTFTSGQQPPGRIDFATSTAGGADTTRFSLTNDGTFRPAANNTYDLGAPTFILNETWTRTLRASGASGLHIGAAPNELISLWGATPVTQNACITDVTGGTIIDLEARAKIAVLIDMAQRAGLVAGGC